MEKFFEKYLVLKDLLLMMHKIFGEIPVSRKKKFRCSVQEFEAKLKEIKKSEEVLLGSDSQALPPSKVGVVLYA